MQYCCSGQFILKLFIASLCISITFSMTQWGADQCPSWLKEYEIFHRKNVKSPSARRLTFSCSGLKIPPSVFSRNETPSEIFINAGSDTVYDNQTASRRFLRGGMEDSCLDWACAGFGNRFRAMLWALRLAAATDRVFHIVHTSDVVLQEVFIPNRINWIPLLGHEQPSDRKNKVQGKPCYSDRGIDAPTSNQAQEIFVVGIQHADEALPSWIPEGKRRIYNLNMSFTSNEAHCLFQSLFKMSPRLEAEVNKEIQLIFGAQDVEYAAVHLRGGNTPFKDGKSKGLSIINDNRGDPYKLLMGSMHCLKKWNLPYFVAANDPEIRAAFARDFFSGAHMRNSTQVLLSGHHQGTAEWLGTFIELGIMAKAKCYISSWSSFSDIARWYSGNVECVRYVISPPDHVPLPSSSECFQEFSSVSNTNEH